MGLRFHQTYFNSHSCLYESDYGVVFRPFDQAYPAVCFDCLIKDRQDKWLINKAIYVSPGNNKEPCKAIKKRKLFTYDDSANKVVLLGAREASKN